MNKLGYPGAAFLVFDKTNRKLALCNSVTGDYKIKDFGYILGWQYQWSIGQRMHTNAMGGPLIPGTNLHQPTVSHSDYKKGFEVVLELVSALAVIRPVVFATYRPPVQASDGVSKNMVDGVILRLFRTG